MRQKVKTTTTVAGTKITRKKEIDKKRVKKNKNEKI